MNSASNRKGPLKIVFYAKIVKNKSFHDATILYSDYLEI